MDTPDADTLDRRSDAGGLIDDDPVIAALDDVLAALAAVAAGAEAASARARDIRRRRSEGLPYREIARPEDRPLLVEVITRHLEAIAEAGARLRRLEARALHDEGLTMEQIAELFGVTRQRVSRLLRENPSGG